MTPPHRYFDRPHACYPKAAVTAYSVFQMRWALPWLIIDVLWNSSHLYDWRRRRYFIFSQRRAVAFLAGHIYWNALWNARRKLPACHTWLSAWWHYWSIASVNSSSIMHVIWAWHEQWPPRSAAWQKWCFLMDKCSVRRWERFSPFKIAFASLLTEYAFLFL